MAKRPAQRGVTLVELLVTIILAAIFFAAAVPVFVFAQKQSSGDRARVIAANVAQSKLEAVRSVKWELLTPGDTYSTWPNDMGGPVKVYSIACNVENVPSTGVPDYKLVTVDVSWTPPPTPVKHVVFKTAIYPQHRGPQIIKMDIENNLGNVLNANRWLTRLPVFVDAQVNSIDLASTDYVRFTMSAANGSFSESQDVPKSSASLDGWFHSPGLGNGAGDGVYTFTAVAVSTEKRLGESWPLDYTLERGAPASPTLVASGVQQAGDGTVSVSWTAPNPIAGDLGYYAIAFSDTPSPPLAPQYPDLSKASTTFIHRLTNRTLYYYTVYAYDERGNSSHSASVPCTPAVQADLTPPLAPTALTSSPPLGQDVTFSWAANATAEGVVAYRVYRDGDPSALTSPIAVIGTDASLASYSYTDPQVGWSVSHTYYVTAVNAVLNESPPTQFGPFTTPAAPSQQPFGLTIKVTGTNDATVMVASLVNGYVYDTDGQHIVDVKSATPISVKKNQGVTFKPLYYSTYRVTVTFVDRNGSPLGTPRSKDVELVRDETITFQF
jgi:prepilin-type N-terminal cleavage/methylation domain-containing protein